MTPSDQAVVTEAPERIWRDPFGAIWADPKNTAQAPDTLTEYLRADIAHEREGECERLRGDLETANIVANGYMRRADKAEADLAASRRNAEGYLAAFTRAQEQIGRLTRELEVARQCK